MSPKLVLWLVAALLATSWYALDPQAGGPFSQAPPAAGVDHEPMPTQRPQIAHNP